MQVKVKDIRAGDYVGGLGTIQSAVTREDGLIVLTGTQAATHYMPESVLSEVTRSAAERTIAGGLCTLCGKGSDELLPWSRERICTPCFDQQLDLLALAIQTETVDRMAGYVFAGVAS